jgi:colicin import membrane protein
MTLASLMQPTGQPAPDAAKAAQEAAAQKAAQAKAAATKAAAAKAAQAKAAAANKPVNNPAAAKAYAAGQLHSYGWDASQMPCLDKLWNRESNWTTSATNSSSGAYGIVQSLPGEKMASAGPDWRTNYETQIDWGMDYIDGRYGTPCDALQFHYANNWY